MVYLQQFGSMLSFAGLHRSGVAVVNDGDDDPDAAAADDEDEDADDEEEDDEDIECCTKTSPSYPTQSRPPDMAFLFSDVLPKLVMVAQLFFRHVQYLQSSLCLQRSLQTVQFATSGVWF